MKDCLRNKGLDVRQARRMVQDRSEYEVLMCVAFVRFVVLGVRSSFVAEPTT